MPDFQVRYTCSGDLQDQIVDFIDKNAQSFIIAREVATREHIQCFVTISVTKKTWVNKFNEKFKNMDRRDKYVEPDKGRTKQYVCKGESVDKDPEIISIRGFSKYDIARFHEEWWSKPDMSEVNEDKAIIPVIEAPVPVIVPDVKVAKPKKPPFMRQMFLEIKGKFPNRKWCLKDKTLVFEWCMNGLGNSCKALDEFIIKRITMGVLNALIDESGSAREEYNIYFYQKAFNECYEEPEWKKPRTEDRERDCPNPILKGMNVDELQNHHKNVELLLKKRGFFEFSQEN